MSRGSKRVGLPWWIALLYQLVSSPTMLVRYVVCTYCRSTRLVNYLRPVCTAVPPFSSPTRSSTIVVPQSSLPFSSIMMFHRVFQRVVNHVVPGASCSPSCSTMLFRHVVPTCCTILLSNHVVPASCSILLFHSVISKWCSDMLFTHAVRHVVSTMLFRHVVPPCCSIIYSCILSHFAIPPCCSTMLFHHVFPPCCSTI